MIDLPAFERNVALMAAWAREKGIALRPHAKTHKSGEIARRQIAAGAVGICCAKLGEAEALAAEGIEDILITSPVVPVQAVERLAGLNRRIRRLTLVIDHPSNADRIAAMIGKDGVGEEGLDVAGRYRHRLPSHRGDLGRGGRGAGPPNHGDRQASLSRRPILLRLAPACRVADARKAALAERTRYLKTILDALADAGLAAETVTGGGTGSFAVDVELGVLNELQVGSYIFMDRQYGDCDPAGPSFEQALAIDTRVSSANTPGRVTVDAGLKSMATEAGPPTVLAGADPASTYVFMGDEHGMLVTPEGGADPLLDDAIALTPPHCDPTVNLYDRYAICDGDTGRRFLAGLGAGRSS